VTPRVRLTSANGKAGTVIVKGIEVPPRVQVAVLGTVQAVVSPETNTNKYGRPV
jgi:hypothetical protein